METLESTERRPFKVCNTQRSKRKGIVARNLDELKEKGCQSLGLIVIASSCRVFIESDGTEIEDDEYLSFIEEQTRLMLIDDELDDWSAPEGVLPHTGSRTSSFDPSSENNESLEMDRTDAAAPIPEFLVHQMIKNPMFFVSFSDEQLHMVIDCDVSYLEMALGLQERECLHYQETCQRELDKRTEIHEASELLKLYDKAVCQKNADSGAKEPDSKKVKTV